MRVFVSYRRSDVGGYAGRLYDDLLPHLGARNVFQDVTGIAVGQDFTHVIDRQLDDTDAVLAVIGPGWLTASTDAGTRRLDDPNDYVRLELSRTLRWGIPVVPVLVGGSRLPTADELPADLAELARRQSVTLRDESWHADVVGLARSLRGEPAVRPPRDRRRIFAGVAAIATVALAGAGVWRCTTGDETNASDGVLPECEEPTGDDWTQIELNAESLRYANVLEETEESRGNNQIVVRDAHWRELDPGSWEVIVETELKANVRPGANHEQDDYDRLVTSEQAFGMSCFTPLPDFVAVETVGTALVGFDVTCKPGGYMQLAMANGSRFSFTKASEPSAC